MAINPLAEAPHNGLADWLIQRISAAVIIVAAVALFIGLVVQTPQGFEQWRDFVMQGWVRVLLGLGGLALVWHAYIGVCDIYIDYIGHRLLRRLKTTGVMIYLLICLLLLAGIVL